MPEDVYSKLSFGDLPEGTVTFLFTDIEGSTHLLSQLRDQYATLLSDQRRILRKAFSRWHGQEVDTQGDAFFVAFVRATQAVSAAVEIQRSLAAHKWTEGVNVRVRMGIHTGEPFKAEEGYVGIDVNRAARIAHVGHGGQVLLSETTAALVRDELPQGVSLLDLGRHRLKDLAQPEHIRQLVIAGWPAEFPLLKSLEHVPPITSWYMSEVKLPAFLEGGVAAPPAQVFVARERELRRLDDYLDEALASKGKVVFIIGDPGRGKTALINGFAQHAIATNPELLAVTGSGNAITGAGDPYLLFREALSMLTGEVEAKWASGTISQEHACRLWSVCPLTAQSLVEYGPNLLEVLVSGKDLLSRLSAAVPDQQGLLQALRAMIERQHTAPGDLAQKALFEQYTQVLSQIARQHPVLLLLDDLQWADAASINLLFHLGRRLGGHRILVVGTYRPEEVALGRGDERHPLESVLNEFKRLYGEAWIDLSDAPGTEGQHLVDALLDSELNHLGKEFREALYAHTGGNPLFTIELLRNLQERGELVRDESENWVEGSQLDWSVLPARVGGVIEERIGRLEEELRELLTVASVEGEVFTAQVVAQVQGLSERKLLHRLSADLEKRHRLVHSRGEDRVGALILSRYQFGHALIQQFLSNALSPGERRLLHKEIAQVLENLYAEKTESIYSQLAHHYSQANEAEKAVHYLLLVGDKARSLYAHQEAIDHYQQALAYLKEMGATEQMARTLMKLYLVYHSCFDFKRAQQALEEGNALWQRLAEQNIKPLLPPAQNPYRLPIINTPIFDPGQCENLFDLEWIKQLFCGLVEWSVDRNVIPLAAKHWEVLDGGCRYVFHLRQDLLWSDGELLTARDFEFAWKRVLDPATHSLSANLLYDILGAKDFHQGRVAGSEQVGITAPDPFTLVVELEEPCGYFPYILGDPISFAVPRHIVEREGNAWTEPGRIVTNGAFQLESWDRGSGKTIHFTRNPRYFGKYKGNIEDVTLVFHQNELDMYQSFVAGELDMVEFLLPQWQQSEWKHYQEVGQLHIWPVPFADAIHFITDRPPFDNPDLRRAFVLATDREKLARVKENQLPASGGYIPPGLPGHSPDIGLSYDPQEARRIMAAAGYPQGRGFPPVSLLLGLVGLKTEDNLVFAILQEMWERNLGVTIQKCWHDSATMKFESCLDFNFFFVGWYADFPDPASFLQTNFLLDQSHWQNPIFEALIEEGRHTLDQDRRVELYRQADRVLTEAAVVLPLFYGHIYQLRQPWVHRLTGASMYSTEWKDITLMPH